MNRGTKPLLKIAVSIIGISIFALCIFGLPWIINGVAEMYPASAYLQYPALISLYVAAIPFSFALYQALRLFSYTNKNKDFSELSVKALKNIKYCAITISALYVVSMPLLAHMGEKDDTPGIVALGLLIILASIISAVFANVFQKRCLRV
jgi:hypothetical protein